MVAGGDSEEEGRKRRRRRRPDEDDGPGEWKSCAAVSSVLLFSLVALLVFAFRRPSAAPTASVSAPVSSRRAADVSPRLGPAVAGKNFHRLGGPIAAAPLVDAPSATGPAPPGEAADEQQVEVDEEQDLGEAKKYWGVLPRDVKDSLAEHVVARAELKKAGRLESRGEPTLTYDRIDKRYADLMAMSLPEYKVRRNLLVLRAERALKGADDAAARRALQGYMDKLPSEMEMMMMPDPGGWRQTVETEKATVHALISDPALRRAFAAQEDGFWAKLHKVVDGQTRPKQ